MCQLVLELPCGCTCLQFLHLCTSDQKLVQEIRKAGNKATIEVEVIVLHEGILEPS